MEHLKGWIVRSTHLETVKLANLEHRVDGIGGGTTGRIEYVNRHFDRKVTWDDAVWLAETWHEPLVIKGLQSPEDAEMALLGATAVAGFSSQRLARSGSTL